MTIADLGALGSFLAAIAVFITLIYLSRQVRQGNILARYQARQNMMEKDLETLNTQISNLDITRAFMKENPTEEELFKLSLFLTIMVRQREWEWFQYNDGVIDEDVYRTYHELIAIMFGTPTTRKWWETVGRMGVDPRFVATVDELLANREFTSYWDNVKDFISSHSTKS